MSSFFSIFDISGSGMSSQMVRLNTTSSNLANSDVIASSEEEAYKARQPVFRTLMDENRSAVSGVYVEEIIDSEEPVVREYQPSNPFSDEQGFVYRPNVNVVEEMANMISASRSYQNNVEVLNTAKQLMLKTLQLGD